MCNSERIYDPICNTVGAVVFKDKEVWRPWERKVLKAFPICEYKSEDEAWDAAYEYLYKYLETHPSEGGHCTYV